MNHYGKRGFSAANQCGYYLWSGVRNAVIFPEGEFGEPVGRNFYRSFNHINVYGSDNDVQWGAGWQELRGAQKFASWYLNVADWHGATAEKLRCGMGGVSHMQQRLQHLTVQLAQAEQALEATQRLRKEEKKMVELAEDMVAGQRGILEDLEEEQEAALEAAKAEKVALAAKLAELESKLAEAIKEKAALMDAATAKGAHEEDAREKAAALQKAQADLHRLQSDFARQQDKMRLDMSELEIQVLVAKQKAERDAEQKLAAEERVRMLESELEKKRDQMSDEVSQVAPMPPAPLPVCVHVTADGVSAYSGDRRNMCVWTTHPAQFQDCPRWPHGTVLEPPTSLVSCWMGAGSGVLLDGGWWVPATASPLLPGCRQTSSRRTWPRPSRS